MGKKKKSSSSGITSKGERRNVARSTVKAMRRDYKANYSRVIANKMEAFFKGFNVTDTIENPNTNETNKRFIKVRFQDAHFKGRDYKAVLSGPKQKKVQTDD
jgi:hypothetical protein